MNLSIRSLMSQPALIGILFLSVLVLSFNLFGFPYYESDEGTYMSQAWSIVTKGQLSPYVFTYDHAPAGWLLIALWSVITGGFHTFGFTINTGRVLMVVLHLFTTLLLYFVTRRVTENHLTALITILFFSFTPLSIYYHRRVLLDNIMVFWVFLSVFCLLYLPTLRGYFMSGIFFGVALLTKETAIFFTPGLIYLMFVYHQQNNSTKRIIFWILITVLIVSIYPLWAYGQGQLFPPGVFGSSSQAHPSLIGSIFSQLQRSGGAPYLSNSALQITFRLWLKEDFLLVVFGFSTIVANLIMAIKYRLPLVPIIFIIPTLLFFLRGGIIYEFYLVPLIPFLSMSVAIFIHLISQIWGQSRIYLTALLFVLFANLVYFGTHSRGGFNLFTAQQTRSQTDAVDWILSQNHPTSFWAIDQSLYLDMVTRNQANFGQALYYWKIETDPTVKSELLGNQPKNINYLTVTPQMEADIKYSQMSFLSSAVSGSHSLKHFENDGWRVVIRSNLKP